MAWNVQNGVRYSEGTGAPGGLALPGELYLNTNDSQLYIGADDGSGAWYPTADTSRPTTDYVNQAATAAKRDELRRVQALDSTVVAINADPMDGTTPNALADSLMRVVGLWIPDPDNEIAGIKWWQSAQGAYTADNNNKVGIMAPTVAGDYSAFTLKASCANDGNLWKGAADTTQSKAFSAAWNPAQDDGLTDPFWAVVLLLYNQSAQTTAPQIGHRSNLGGANYSRAFTGSSGFKPAGYVTGQTDLPATLAMSSVTAYAQSPIVAAYV